ncbi:MAG: SDR family oxidoreductase [Chloroflexi bacterium]|nr:SDR family oxidoreductase [Chloroflexota bacterium]
MRLTDKVACITGAGSGIGRATAELFAQEGAKVAVVDLSQDTGEQVVEAIREAGGEAFFQRADVSDAADVRRALDGTVERFGRIDVLYNNAGIPMGFTPIEEVDDDFFDKMMAVNVRSVHLGCKYVVPHMKRQGGGVILNTASTAGIRPRPGLSAYAGSKGAVIAMTKALALELAPFRIRVVSINPVATDTPMLPGFFGQMDPKEARERFIASVPLGRLNTPVDIAQAVLYLASDEAFMVTGTAFEIDGGRDI